MEDSVLVHFVGCVFCVWYDLCILRYVCSRYVVSYDGESVKDLGSGDRLGAK